MEPTYHNLSFVIVDKMNRDFIANDVVAIDSRKLSCVIVKRIIAGPGDSVEITGGKLIVNGKESEVFQNQTFEYAGLLEQKCILEENQYIVLGDNIAESIDSRYSEVGIIDEEVIIGVVK